MAIVPALCTVVSFFTAVTDPLALFPMSIVWIGVHHMSIAYSTFSRATPMYSLLAYLGVTPQEGRVALLICAAHFEPFSVTCAICVFHF
jgi:hypothetical protein